MQDEGHVEITRANSTSQQAQVLLPIPRFINAIISQLENIVNEIEVQSGLDFRVDCPDLVDAVSGHASTSPKTLPPGPEVPNCLYPTIRPVTLAQNTPVLGGVSPPSDPITVEGPAGILVFK